MTDMLHIANHTFQSRLFVGTGKFSSIPVMTEAIRATETELITIALRRVNLSQEDDPFKDLIASKKYIFMPNTSGARNSEEVLRLAALIQRSGVSNWIKLEVTPEPNYLLPDPIETLIAAEKLVKMGFHVLPYINADPILAKRLEEVGCVTVMPLAAPIGSNRGLETREQLQIIIEQSQVPVVVDAGLGAPSHAAEAMELGADAVLVNTAIAISNQPVLMASAFKDAVIAGRNAYLAGVAPPSIKAEASSPLTGFLNT